MNGAILYAQLKRTPAARLRFSYQAFFSYRGNRTDPPTLPSTPTTIFPHVGSPPTPLTRLRDTFRRRLHPVVAGGESVSESCLPAFLLRLEALFPCSRGAWLLRNATTARKGDGHNKGRTEETRNDQKNRFASYTTRGFYPGGLNRRPRHLPAGARLSNDPADGVAVIGNHRSSTAVSRCTRFALLHLLLRRPVVTAAVPNARTGSHCCSSGSHVSRACA